jgi:hypothetical protein
MEHKDNRPTMLRRQSRWAAGAWSLVGAWSLCHTLWHYGEAAIKGDLPTLADLALSVGLVSGSCATWSGKQWGPPLMLALLPVVAFITVDMLLFLAVKAKPSPAFFAPGALLLLCLYTIALLGIPYVARHRDR